MRGVSAIIALSESQKYELKKTLQSIGRQSVQPDEIIIVDGSFGDDNYAYVKSFFSESAIYVRAQDDCGGPLSIKQLFEIGAKRATGEYAAFAFPGDEWVSKKVESALAAIGSNPGLDLLVHSCNRRVSFSDESFCVESLAGNLECLFHFWLNPSAALVKKNLFFCLDELSGEEIQGLKVAKLSDVLCGVVWRAPKDLAALQSAFWKENCAQIKRKNCVQEAALYCLKTLQRAPLSANAFSCFAKIVGLAPEDAPLVLFDKKDFAVKTEIAPSPEQEKLVAERDKTISELRAALDYKSALADKNRQNYLFARGWLEMKVAGMTAAQNLKERGVSSILIYGAGRHGTILFNELKNSDVKVLAWVDKNPKSDSYLGLPVLTLEELSDPTPKADAIVVTPFMEYEAISKDLERLGFDKVISLKALVS